MKVRCEWCRGAGKNAMGVPCSKCRATGEVEIADAPAPLASTKTDALRGENGGFVVSRGKPRYAFLQGKHLVVGRGKVEEFATLADAYRRRDELLRAEATKAKKS